MDKVEERDECEERGGGDYDACLKGQSGKFEKWEDRIPHLSGESFQETCPFDSRQ